MPKAIAQYTIRDENDITVGATAPTSPILNQMWLDTSGKPSILKRWNGTTWDVVNDIEIGGRNLIKDSNFGGVPQVSNIYGFATRGGEYLQLEAGKQYTLSFNGSVDAQTIVDAKELRVFVYENSWVCSTSIATKTLIATTTSITFTCTKTAAYSVSSYLFSASGSMLGKVTVNWYKLEKGNKATDWTPAPEDIIERVATTEQKMTPTGITTIVSEALAGAGVINNSIMKFDKTGIEVSHSSASTKTKLSAQGFYITDAKNETIASLASAEAWSTLRATYVFATNIETIYTGPSNIYVDHTTKVQIRNGSAAAPFATFIECANYLQATPVINKIITINVVAAGTFTDTISLVSIKGVGSLTIILNKNISINALPLGTFALKMVSIGITVIIRGGRTSWNTADGAMLTGGQTGYIQDSLYVGVTDFRVNSNPDSYGIQVINSRAYIAYVDFMNSYCAMGAMYLSQVYMNACCGNGPSCYRSFHGAVVTSGDTSNGDCRPNGLLQEYSGKINIIGSFSVQNSFTSPPPIPPTSDQTIGYAFNDYGYYSELYNNWNPNGKTVYQGDWGYGNNRGVFTFPIADIRGMLSNATVLDGSTIYVQRENAGGYSGAQPIYLCGTTHTSPGGSAPPVTRQYGQIGSLAWGQAGTFGLPKAFVDDMKSGVISSVMFYGGAYVKFSSACYIYLRVNR